MLSNKKKKKRFVTDTLMCTVASGRMAVKSRGWTSEGPLLYKAFGTLGHNEPFVVAPVKGQVPRQTLWPISNPFTKLHFVSDHRKEES